MPPKRKRCGGFSFEQPAEHERVETSESDSGDDMPLAKLLVRRRASQEANPGPVMENVELDKVCENVVFPQGTQLIYPQPDATSNTTDEELNKLIDMLSVIHPNEIPPAESVNINSSLVETERAVDESAVVFVQLDCQDIPNLPPVHDDESVSTREPNSELDCHSHVPICDENLIVVGGDLNRGNNTDDENDSDLDNFQHALPRHRQRGHGAAFIDGSIVTEDIRENNVGRMILECESCLAKLFPGEVNSRKMGGKLCCLDGKVVLQPFNNCHPIVYNLLTSPNVHFRKNIRMYNAALSFASFEANIDPLEPGSYVFRINGTPYHRIGCVNPPPGSNPRYAQMYIVDNATATGLRSEAFTECNQDTLLALDAVLREINPYCAAYKMIHEIEQDERVVADQENRPMREIVMVLKNPTDPQPDRRYDAPAANEVAIIFKGDVPENLPNIQIYLKNSGLKTLSILSPHTDPLVYPLLFQHGDQGYHCDIPHHAVRGRAGIRARVTMREYYAYHLSVRDEFNIILSSGKLTHQYIVDSWVRTEHNRVKYIQLNQKKLRADLYTGLADHLNRVADHDRARVGKMVILPSTFVNSPRHQFENYIDAVTIFKNTGQPTYFITFTCNPNWEEVTRELNDYEIANDRPDILDRVFRQKLNDLLHDLVERHILGVHTSHICVVEYQKRGLCHAHIVLGVRQVDSVQSSDCIDQRVSAELPDEGTQPRLFQLVTRHMIHGPCGETNPRSPCMVNGQCKKKYPKQFQSTTLYNPGGYPIYRRRNNGQYAVVRRSQVDNRHVVPYNPYLLMKYNAHINIEICSGQKWVKYLFKYCFKGQDCLSVAFHEGDNTRVVNYDECKSYVDCRYVSAPEAYWRLVGFPLVKMSHTITKLPVHLPGQNLIVFNEENIEQVLENENMGETRLTSFFKLNERDGNARQYLYKEIPLHYRYDTSTKTWLERRRSQRVVSRLYENNVKDRERYALHLLLGVVRGPRSFEELKFVNGVQYDTFQQAAEALHLMENDVDSITCMEEAVQYKMPSALRRLFVTVCLYNQVSPPHLWNMFAEEMYDDLKRRHGLNTHDAKNAALQHIERLLKENGSSCEKLGLPSPIENEATLFQVDDGDDIEIVRNEQHSVYNVDSLNVKQRQCYDAIMHAVEVYREGDRETVKTFFIDGIGGSGKSFLYETIIATLKERDEKVISVAMSGVAATLLTGGQTVHSAFRLPFQVDETTTCNITLQSAEANNIQQAVVVLWDEASMISCNVLHAVDRLLKDVMNSSCIFGGKVVVLGGDFRQILPIVKYGSRAQQIDACVKSSPLWPSIRLFQLDVNMRAVEEDGRFATWVKSIGDGALPRIQYVDQNNRVIKLSRNSVEIPQQLLYQGNIDDWVFDDVSSDNISSCAILCPRNIDVDEINERVLQKLPGPLITFFSSNVQSDVNLQAHEDRDEVILPQELLDSFNSNGIPPHTLKIKVNAIIMLLRNIDVKNGMCNGTRMKVNEIGENVIKCTIVSGPKQGQVALLGRLSLSPSDSAINFKRSQFPVRLSYAMTINKAQGQTLSRVGLYLPTPVFSHGQLYVALSRCRKFDDIRVLIKETRQQGSVAALGITVTQNIVYKEIL